MGFWTLFEVASMPVLQVLLIGGLGAFMATSYCNLLHADARRSLNKIVFMIFIPSLMFADLAKTVTFEQLVSWWFMPVNVGLTFLFGGILGWIAVKLLKPERHLEGLVIAVCSAGNLGDLMLIIVPAICNQRGSPFGDQELCRSVGLSYASFSMALGGFYIWTYTFHLVRSTAISYKALQAAEESEKKDANKDFDANEESHLLAFQVDTENQTVVHLGEVKKEKQLIWTSLTEFLHQIIEELMSPPTISAMFGLVFGAVPWLKSYTRIQDRQAEATYDLRCPSRKVLVASYHWCGFGSTSWPARVPSTGSAVPFCADDAIHPSTRHEHWYNDAAV